MADETLIVPVLLPSGSLQFATISSNGTVQDVLDYLIAKADLTSEVLGDLEPYGWAMQRIRVERNGRQWEEDELEALGNGVFACASRLSMILMWGKGIVNPQTAVAPLLNATAPAADAQRHFSTFPLTSHLHTPCLRLVSLHPFLVLSCDFARVPEIHDGFQWKLFVSRDSNVQAAVDAVVQELGLTKSLPIPGGGALEYVLEEVWADQETESAYDDPEPCGERLMT